jgi:hypothetical protein
MNKQRSRFWLAAQLHICLLQQHAAAAGYLCTHNPLYVNKL